MIFLAPLYMPFHDVVKIDINIMFNKNPMNGHLEQFLLHKMSSTLGILLPKLFLLCAEICRVNVQKLKMQVTMGRKDSQGSRHLSCTYLISPSSILSKALGFYAEPAEFYKPPPHTHISHLVSQALTRVMPELWVRDKPWAQPSVTPKPKLQNSKTKPN